MSVEENNKMLSDVSSTMFLLFSVFKLSRVLFTSIGYILKFYENVNDMQNLNINNIPILQKFNCL